MDTHIQKTEFTFPPHPIHTNTLKITFQNPNIGGKALPFERKTVINLHDLGLGSSFLDMTAKHK